MEAVPRLGNRANEGGALAVEVALVCVDPADELPDLGCLPEAKRVLPEGVERSVHRVQHAERSVRVEGADRVFELAGHRGTGPWDGRCRIYGSRIGIFR